MEVALNKSVTPSGAKNSDPDLYAMLADAAGQQRDEAALRKYAPLAEETATRINHKLYTAIAHRAWGVAHRLTKDYAESERRFNLALDIFQELDTRWQSGRTLFELGELARSQGRYNPAKRYYREGLELARELGDKFLIAIASCNLGYTALHNGELDSARSLFAESLALVRELNYKPTMAFALLGFGGLAAVEKQASRAVQILAVVDAALEGEDRRFVTPADEAEFKLRLAMARDQLDEGAFDEAWAAGRAMTLEQAAGYALENVK